MKRLGMALFLAGALAALSPLDVRADAPLDSMLLWLVNDDYDPPGNIDDHGTMKFIDELVDANGNRVNGARIRFDGNGDSGYLGIYSGDGQTLFPNAVMTIDLNSLAATGTAGPGWSNLGAYTDAAYAFTIELGHWEAGGEWDVLATSRESMTYAELFAGGWVSSSSDAYPREGPWAPTFSIPEPSSGLLLLIGGALLALRRKVEKVEG